MQHLLEEPGRNLPPRPLQLPASYQQAPVSARPGTEGQRKLRESCFFTNPPLLSNPRLTNALLFRSSSWTMARNVVKGTEGTPIASDTGVPGVQKTRRVKRAHG